MRGSTGQDDLPDPERTGLSLVEVQRGDELTGERGESALDPLVGLCALLDREPFDCDRLRERELPLDRLDFARRLVQLPRDRDVERPSAPVQDACELAVLSAGHGDRGAVVADGDRDERAPAGEGIAGCGKRAKKRERLEIDADDLETRPATGLQVAVDDLAVRDDEKDPENGRAVLVRTVVEDDPVEHRLVERDREDLLGTEANRVLQLAGVGDPFDLEHANADAVVGDPEADTFLRKLVQLEKSRERAREGDRVANLPRDHHTGLERLPNSLDELRHAVVEDAGRGDLGRADLEADELLRTLLLLGHGRGVGRAPCACGAPSRAPRQAQRR